MFLDYFGTISRSYDIYRHHLKGDKDKLMNVNPTGNVPDLSCRGGPRLLKEDPNVYVVRWGRLRGVPTVRPKLSMGCVLID